MLEAPMAKTPPKRTYEGETTNVSIHLSKQLLADFDALLAEMRPRPSRSSMLVTMIEDKIREQDRKK